MNDSNFQSLVINKDENGYTTKVQTLTPADLPEGDVLIDVLYSTLNYKDALAITGKGPVIRHFPMVPGIDFVGVVKASEHTEFKVGDQVILNGFGVGERHFGGLAQKARVKGDWLIKLPSKMSAADAMAIGTAGYTAMLCVIALQKQGLTVDRGPILVTGATGGVGSFAIKILSKLGYQVVASSGSKEQHPYLTTLGADEVIDRSELAISGKPLMKERWAAAIDSVGSTTLANVCASIQYGGAVAACGLAQGMDFPATVAPFILRGVSLLGIDSVMRSKPDRIEAWDKLSTLLTSDDTQAMSTVIGLTQVMATADILLQGNLTGRVVVDVNCL